MYKHTGKIIILIGVMLLIPVGLHLFSQSNAIGTYSTAPPTPAGVGGWVKDAGGSLVPDGIEVYAKNLATGDIDYRTTQNGFYAIPVSARTGDLIEVTAVMSGEQVKRTIEVDLGNPTQWCNLTFGESEDIHLDLWLLIIPFGCIGSGVIVDYAGKKK